MAWYTYSTNTFKPFYFVEIRLTTTPIGTYELDTRLSLHSLYFVSNHGPIMKYSIQFKFIQVQDQGTI